MLESHKTIQLQQLFVIDYIELTFLAKQNPKHDLSFTLKKQQNLKNLDIRKNKRLKAQQEDTENMLKSCAVKIKRNCVAENIACFNHALEQNKEIKKRINEKGDKLVYQLFRQNSTYAYLSLFMQKSNSEAKKLLEKESMSKTSSSKQFLAKSFKSTKTPIPNNSDQICFPNQKPDINFFIDNPWNQLLKKKFKQSFIFHKNRKENHQQLKRDKPVQNNQTADNLNQIKFDSQFQSGNVQFVAKILNSQKRIYPQIENRLNESKIPGKFSNLLEYEIYLRNDTNTHGHQNWFYFSLYNDSNQAKRIRINVVNLKRNLNLVKDGQKIYLRTTFPLSTEWKTAGQNIQVNLNKQLSSGNFYKCRVYVMSFDLFDIQPGTKYEISLLPPYTYTDMLNDIMKLRQNENVKIDILTYSLTGLAIPMLSFSNFGPILPQKVETNDSESPRRKSKISKTQNQRQKQVILISSRIHPGQTVASFIVKGIMQALSSPFQDNYQLQQLLNTTIIKIIPMINPDGVVFGNFRTNFLGYDLNRSFNSDDEITNPEVVALKQIGRRLKSVYGDKFTTFIDLHGHSSQKNIFTYGPHYQAGHQKFYKARLFPKLLNSKSPFFNYNLCSFKLQEYKLNTARGYFLNTLDVPAFTIESSYAVFQKQDGKTGILTQKEWMQFGTTLYQSFVQMQKLGKSHHIKNRTQLKRAISHTEEQGFGLVSVLSKQIKKQKSPCKRSARKKQVADIIDSDGEDQNEDLNSSQRQAIEQKLAQNSIKNLILPKVFKPSILYPTVTPKLFNIDGGQVSTSISSLANNNMSYKILYTRRNRYHSIKIPGGNYNISTYLHSLNGRELLKPKARNIKMENQLS